VPVIAPDKAKMANFLGPEPIKDGQLVKGAMVKWYNPESEDWQRAEVVDLQVFTKSEKPVKIEPFRAASEEKAKKPKAAAKSKEKAAAKPKGKETAKAAAKPAAKPSEPGAQWVAVASLRLMNDNKIDWDIIDDKIPDRQDPESRANRKVLFQSWDTDANGCLSIEELTKGLNTTLGNAVGGDVEEITSCIKGAYELASKLDHPSVKKKESAKKAQAAADKKLSPGEFHPFLLALRSYLHIAEIFEEMDSAYIGEDDQKLSYRECCAGLHSLEDWGIDAARLKESYKELFGDAANYTPVLKFEDLASWCIRTKWAALDLKLDPESDDEEIQLNAAAHVMRRKTGGFTDYHGHIDDVEKDGVQTKLMQQFREWDSDHSGGISEDELVAVLTKLDADNFTPEKAKALFRLSDINQDGKVDYEEFCKWVLK